MCHFEVRNCFSCSYSPWNTSLNMLRVVVLLVLDILWTSYLKFKLNDPEVILLANHRRPRVLYFVFKRRRVEKKVDGLAYRYYCHVSLSFSNMIEEKITDMNIGGVVIFTKSLFIFLLLDVYLKGMSWISSDHNSSFLCYIVCINLHWYLICFIKSVRIICCEQHGGRTTFGDGKETIGCWAAGRSPAALSLSCW